MVDKEIVFARQSGNLIGTRGEEERVRATASRGGGRKEEGGTGRTASLKRHLLR
jgi:hypothetical protein